LYGFSECFLRTSQGVVDFPNKQGECVNRDGSTVYEVVSTMTPEVKNDVKNRGVLTLTTTWYSTNNNSNGLYFNITAKQSILLLGFATETYDDKKGPFSVNVCVSEAGFNNNMGTPSHWKKVFENNFDQSRRHERVNIRFDEPIVIQKGVCLGFYVHSTSELLISTDARLGEMPTNDDYLEISPGFIHHTALWTNASSGYGYSFVGNIYYHPQ